MRPVSSHGYGSAAALASTSGNFLSNGLSLSETHLLRKMWPSGSIEQSYELGLEIFDEVFRLEPDVKSFFPCLCAESAKDIPLRQVAEFQSHIIRFVSMLTLCVKYCDQPQHLGDRLFDLGRRHRQYITGAETKHFRVFEKALSMVMRRRAELHGVEDPEDCDSGYSGGTSVTWHPSSPMDKAYASAKFRNPKEQVRATIAWTSLAAYITKQITKGYSSEMESNSAGHENNANG